MSEKSENVRAIDRAIDVLECRGLGLRQNWGRQLSVQV
jgi:hypothetical protein